MISLEKPVRVVSSIGNPRDRRTWSGTPSAILDAFDRLGVPIDEHVISLRRPLKYLYAGTNLLGGYGRALPDRIGLWSLHLRSAASALSRNLGPGTFLHFGSGHLPLINRQPDQRHFLVSDYSMHLDVTRGRMATQVTPRFRRVALAAEARMADQLDAIFTISRYVRDDWIEKYKLAPDKVVPIGTGLGSHIALDGHVKDYRNGHLLYVGKHGFDIKGGQLLVDGFLHALKTRPDLKLIVIADAKDPALLPYLPKIRANPSIHLYQSGTPDFADLVRAAALYAAPAEREPWGLIYLESLMCETPVLGLNRNAMMELTDNGRVGFVIEEASAMAVGRAIVEAMSDGARLARMGQAGREYVEANFTWGRVADTILRRISVMP